MSLEGFCAEHVVLTVAAVVFIHHLGVPIPSMPVLVWAGGMASGEPLLAVWAFALATVAGAAGDLPWYWAARRYGYRILRLVCRVTVSPDACVRQSEIAFKQRGPAMLVTGGLLPGLGSIAASLAGALRAPASTFLLYDTTGSALRAAAGLTIGFLFHDQVARLVDLLAAVRMKATMMVAGALVAYITYRMLQRWIFMKSLSAARVSVEELRDMMRRGDDPIVLDVRTQAHRRLDGRKIPGAQAVDLGDIECTLAAIPRDREMVVYCACPNEASAAKVTLQLRTRGFYHVRPLSGGIDAWASAGLPIERYASDVAADYAGESVRRHVDGAILR